MAQDQILCLDKEKFYALTELLDYVIESERKDYAEASERAKKSHVYRYALEIYNEMVGQDLF